VSIDAMKFSQASNTTTDPTKNCHPIFN